MTSRLARRTGGPPAVHSGRRRARPPPVPSGQPRHAAVVATLQGMVLTSSLDAPLLREVRAWGARQGGVMSRRDLYGLGVTRWQVLGEVRARRWTRVGDQSVCLYTGPMSQDAHRWAAVFQGGPRACLDGAAALVAAGLQRYEVDRIRVSVPRGARVRRSAVYDVRQTRRWSAADVVTRGGPPRTRPEVAAVRGALWAATERQATYLLIATVQQGLTTPELLGREVLRVRRDRRRLLLHEVVLELLAGARSLGELDVVRALGARGLPVPDRQVLRRDARGRYYLDLYWSSYRVVVEVDGIHHTWVDQVAADALRQNALVLSGDTVLRIPLLGLRLQPEMFLDQVEDALRLGGWARAA